MVSIVWEMARRNPVCGFLVEAWSLRGYEIGQEWTSFAIGLALLLLALAVAPKRSVGGRYATAVVGLGTIAGTAPTHACGPHVVSITFSTVVVAVLSAWPAVMRHQTFRSLVLPRFPALDRFAIGVLAGLSPPAPIFITLMSAVGSRRVNLNQGLAAFDGPGLLGLFALAPVPHGLAANRFLISVTVLGGAVIGPPEGSLRTSLREAQVETLGVGA